MALNGGEIVATRIARSWLDMRDRIGLSRAAPASVGAHLHAAIAWLCRAQDVSGCDGVAAAFDLRTRRWEAAYPETTGYIIPTMYEYARRYGAAEVADRARRMALWEIGIQCPGGGIPAGTLAAIRRVPTIFNTGQVLFGWARAYEETGDGRFLAALQRGADWLVAAQDEDGHWRRFPSPFTKTGPLRSYNTRTAYALTVAGRLTGEQRYFAAARRNVAAVLATTHPDGWLPNNCLDFDAAPLVHTIAYSIRGIVEVGAAVGRRDFVEAAAAMAEGVASAQRPDGSIPGRLTPGWKAGARWSCVTGNSQMAINWLRLAELTGRTAFVRHALRANRFNMSVQFHGSTDPDLKGGVKGSHPLGGGYMAYQLPNWAAKFFADALLAELHAGSA